MMRLFNIKLICQIVITVLLIPTSHAEILSNDIQKIFSKSIYKNARWGLRVIDQKTNNVLIDISPKDKFFIGSVRKIFSVGEMLNVVGPDYRSVTTVHRDGKITNGHLEGNVVLIASGDLTMGGRTKPNGDIAITDYDHNEADSLGNAQITNTDPLAGYKNLAKQVKKAGINKITGDVIIDERLFDPFNFREEFDVSPIFVNDDVIDVIIKPGKINKKSVVDWRPHSNAFSLVNNLITAKGNAKYSLALNPEMLLCIGQPDCHGEINGQLPVSYIPPLTHSYPLIQTVRITKPTNYARIIFIEALREAGVDVSELKLLKDNPDTLLKPRDFYNKNNQIASLKSLPFSDHAKFILKVSYNIGADTSLVLFGLSQGVRNMADSLRVERNLLQTKYGISPDNFVFVDGSGGGDTTATNATVTTWLQMMAKKDAYQSFFNALPILGVDGSLVFVNDFQSNPTLAGARNKVRAKTGTYVKSEGDHIMLKGQSLAGYVTTKNNNHLIFQLVVNDVAIQSLTDVLSVFQDQGTIAAILWRDF